MAGHEWEDWFEREEFIGQISDIRVQNLQVEREVVQKRTFTRWMNLHLEKCNPPVEVHDLFRDIQDGHILMALLEELSGCKLLHGFKKSSHRIFRLNNIAKVLSFLEERNVKLVSIDAADVADGNSSIILGLIWNIILFFQIKELTGNIRSQFPSCSSLSSIPTSSDSDASFSSTPSDERQSTSNPMREHSKAIKKLLQWVQRRTRKYGVAVQDFGKSWTSGLAFLAVIKSIDSSLVDMRKALLRSPRENLEDAFRIAHYSLGIPRLLEPEDMAINAPDDQSIIMYVSQFLEHFPGIEEPEEPCQLIERSVSMGRLNFRDSDYLRNGAHHRSRVRERSYMFQKDSSAPPPKILISSVSEDRGTVTPRFRPAAARSWSTEDFLADSPEENTTSVVKDQSKPGTPVVRDSDSPQLCHTHSPTDSSVPESVNTESVIGDSAISSPDSWVESEYGVTPEKFCESRSDSSLCDSGTAWDLYRATPVEITSLDDGYMPPTEDRISDEPQTSESYIDEGIYSLSSLENAQERIHGQSDQKPVEEIKGKESPELKSALKQTPEKDQTKVTEEVNSKQMDKSILDKVPSDQEPSLGFSETEELTSLSGESVLEPNETNQNQSSAITEKPLLDSSTEEPGIKEGRTYIESKVTDTGEAQDLQGQSNVQPESLSKRGNSQEVEVESGCQETESGVEEKPGQSKDESGMILKDLDDSIVESQDKVSEEGLKGQESLETPDIIANINSDTQDDASKTNLEPSIGINIPLISISSEPEVLEEEEEATCVTEVQNHSGDEDSHRPEVSGSNESDTNITSPQNTNEVSFVSNKDTDGDLTESVGIITSVQPKATENGHLGDKGVQSPVTAEPNGKILTVDTDSSTASKHMDLFCTDVGRSSPSGDLVDLIEPMDLFYPDKEEPMFTEPPDNEMQSWPSVLSVSALQPAPTSESLPEEQPFNQQDEDTGTRVDLHQGQVKVITEIHKDTDRPSESQEWSSLPGKKIGGPTGADGQEDSIDLIAGRPQGADSAKENTDSVRSIIKSSCRPDENQIPPVLRHRKGTRFAESTDNQRAVSVSARKAEDDRSDFWLGEDWETYLLLLLWLLLYCFWVLPQIDLKTLPSLLLNIKH
ncbi:calmin isoform X1 [Sphaeramia orbicularis]|uniref:calmin isoform X1 n=1 Tax=Sphaeramia orbicularis TaxID=375764 RepID=UPI00117E0386|nr:calmin isoform X1 [Sphaeramia orbicularis]